MQHQRDLSDVETIREALLWASSFLRDAGMRDPQFEAELLMRHCLGMDRAKFLASHRDPIENEALEQLVNLCRRRAAQEPIQYMLGEQAFYGREFEVGAGVLIPRPETEILVEELLKRADHMWKRDANLQVADVGTGSGAIAITLACERAEWNVTTIDVSAPAIAIAKRNAERLHASVRFLEGDLLGPIIDAGQQLDILVSNPPYIPSSDVDQLDEEVRVFEPRLALDGGKDGLDFYRRLCLALPKVLKPTALVGFEVGIHQAQDVAALLEASGVIDKVEIINDLAGIERVVIGSRTIS